MTLFEQLDDVGLDARYLHLPGECDGGKPEHGDDGVTLV